VLELISEIEKLKAKNCFATNNEDVKIHFLDNTEIVVYNVIEAQKLYSTIRMSIWVLDLNSMVASFSSMEY